MAQGSGTRGYLQATTAVETAARIRSGDLSAVAATQSALDRMAAVNPQIHAVCTPTPDLALAAAVALDRRIADGEPVGSLAGVPFAVKDLILTRGIRTTMGSPLYRDYVPEEDDIVVHRMLAADAILIGKTNASELGYAAHGRNAPWNIALTPGGSSAGSGAAVAAGIVPLALGSDGGGSIRIPASFCGIVGMKASMGRVPVWPSCRDDRQPGISSWESLEHIGPLTRTVADAALMLSVLAGPDPRDRHSIPNEVDWQAPPGDLRGMRVACGLGGHAVDPEVRAAFAHAGRIFTDELGCEVLHDYPALPTELNDGFAALEAMETDLVALRSLCNFHREETVPELLQVLDHDWTAEDFSTAIVTRKRVCRIMSAFMQDYELFLTPTLASLPFPVEMDGPPTIDGSEVGANDWACFSVLTNLTGQPAISLNMGWSKMGLPIGLQIIGRHLADATVLSAAARFEATVGTGTTNRSWEQT
jgi:aspartyl-tRNA(Asn)/glutamyl-tRNA(Gln) amidotransferase subunit A